MLTSPSAAAALRRDLRIIVRVDSIGVLALASIQWPSDVIWVVLVLGLIIAPLSLLPPMRWRNEIDEEAAMRYGLPFFTGFLAIPVGAWGASQGSAFPTTALIMGFGAIHMAAILVYLGVTRAYFRQLSPWLAASALGSLGALADLPRGLACHTMSFFFYGIMAVIVMQRITTLARAQSDGRATNPEPA
ncbi:MAG: hypothetical protein ACRD2W_14685 [Acidimicrobiales bacterium]